MPFVPDPAVEWTVVSCWLLFAAVWIAGWIYNLLRAPKVERRAISPSVLAGAGIAWFVSWLVPQSVWNALVVVSPVLQGMGIALVVAGTGFALWARAALGIMWNGIPSRRAGHELRTKGPFSIARHPIYTGVLAMLVGTALACGVGPFAGPVIAGAIGLALKMRVEEKILLETFGTDYEAYRARVRALLPIPRFRT
jgi:protein-S-isoprenylcysteine O-methyltransferase Ste14